jgi:hypothetical protein
MRAQAYIETSMVSYLAARPSRDIVAAAHQQISTDWWVRRRKDFELCTSQLLTWNCSHIANAEILPRVAMICERSGLDLPYVCTPEELLGDFQ